MKKVFIVFLVTALFLLTACGGNETAQTSSDTTETFIDAAIEPFQSFDQLLENSAMVVTGTTTKIESYLVENPDPDLSFYNTLSNVKVADVLQGDQNVGSIRLQQMGAPDQQEPERKLKKGGTYVLFLGDKAIDEETGYWSTNMDEGVFEVIDGKIHSYSDNPVMQAYNGKTLEEFTALIREKIK
jgi:hypothetical protein